MSHLRDEEVTCIKQEGHRIWLSFNPAITPVQKLIAEITSKQAIADLFVENPPIEETIAKLYRNIPS